MVGHHTDAARGLSDKSTANQIPYETPKDSVQLTVSPRSKIGSTDQPTPIRLEGARIVRRQSGDVESCALL